MMQVEATELDSGLARRAGQGAGRVPAAGIEYVCVQGGGGGAAGRGCAEWSKAMVARVYVRNIRREEWHVGCSTATTCPKVAMMCLTTPRPDVLDDTVA